jgi:hypothetical protein
VLRAIAAPLLAATLGWIEPGALQPGQRGTCVTEWSGGERLEIPIEVVGVLDAAAPERSAVLVRLLDPRFAESGVVAGMSGSPVYVDGQLVGAVAFGWQFAREPIAGVTPFGRMHELAGGGAPPTGTVPTLETLVGLATGRLGPDAAFAAPPARPTGGLLPTAVVGLPADDAFGRRLLGRLGLQTAPAGRGAAAGLPGAGDMAATLLVWGDAVIAAGGTVTARDGDRLWAYGHPFLALGDVALPAARARVLAIQTSYADPFKLFTVGEPFGTFVADRPAGMLAVAGAVPAGLPVTVDVSEPRGARNWSFRVAETPLLVPFLVTYVVNASLTAQAAAAGDASARLVLDLALADGRTVHLEQIASSPDALARVASFAGAVTAFIAGSPFPHPAITGVRASVERREMLTGAQLIAAVPARTRVRPGERLPVTVRFARHLNEAEERTVTVAVPADLAEGPLDLIVADGASWGEYRQRAEGAAAVDFDGQLAQLAMLEPASNLVAALELRDGGIALAGDAQPGVPPSWSATLAIGLGKGNLRRLTSAVVATSRTAMPFPLTGAFRVPLTVSPSSGDRP